MSVLNEPSKVELCSVPSDYGRGANDGAYYPVGLLTVGTHLRRTLNQIGVSIIDLHHQAYEPSADVVGISASSSLNYRNVLRVAQSAKQKGATVVLGGPHATQLTNQILRNRTGLVDFVIRGNGETAFVKLIDALQTGSALSEVPNLSWRTPTGSIHHNQASKIPWEYEQFLPLDLSLLRCGMRSYWNTFQQRIDPTVNAALIVFTHFGCGYREMMQTRSITNQRRLARWCSYCSLNDPLRMRSGKSIVEEVLVLLRLCRVPTGSNVLLKCYGDNIGTHQAMLSELASEIDNSDEWQQYRIKWTFYAQSSRVSEDLIKLLVNVGTRNLYIGFDSADDQIQRFNGLGTSMRSHQRAVSLCQEYGIKIQAGFVLGCAGETSQSIHTTLQFAEELASKGVLERINSAVLFIIPGSPAYTLLSEREPWIKDLDDLPTEELQWQWIRHYCPTLGKNPSDGLINLLRAANRLDELSPGPHASMGFISKRLAAQSL